MAATEPLEKKRLPVKIFQSFSQVQHQPAGATYPARGHFHNVICNRSCPEVLHHGLGRRDYSRPGGHWSIPD